MDILPFAYNFKKQNRQDKLYNTSKALHTKIITIKPKHKTETGYGEEKVEVKHYSQGLLARDEVTGRK